MLLCYSLLLKVRAENYFQAGNWSEPILLNIESLSQEGILEGAIYGLVAVAALITVELVILIVLNVVCYWQLRKDKVNKFVSSDTPVLGSM